MSHHIVQSIDWRTVAARRLEIIEELHRELRELEACLDESVCMDPITPNPGTSRVIVEIDRLSEWITLWPEGRPLKGEAVAVEFVTDGKYRLLEAILRLAETGRGG